MEHGIDSDGKTNMKLEKFENDMLRSFNSETKSGQLVPRSLMIDLDPAAIEQIKTGQFKNVYTED